MNPTRLRLLSLPLVSLLAASSACAGFSFDDDGKRLTVLENNQPVLSYNYGRMDPPEGIGPEFWRSNYVHPLYGLDGEILTQDFPDDHPHHRGVFWTWPEVRAGERATNVWALRGSRQLFLGWTETEATTEMARLGFRAGWRFDEQWEPFVIEEVEILVHAAKRSPRH